jgi:hypothetical protein
MRIVRVFLYENKAISYGVSITFLRIVISDLRGMQAGYTVVELGIGDVRAKRKIILEALRIQKVDIRKEIIVCHLCLIQFVIDYSTVSTYCQVFSKIDI